MLLPLIIEPDASLSSSRRRPCRREAHLSAPGLASMEAISKSLRSTSSLLAMFRFRLPLTQEVAERQCGHQQERESDEDVGDDARGVRPDSAAGV